MTVEAIVSAVLVLVGIALVATALSRWGRPGSPPRRIGGLVLAGAGAMVAGATTMSGGSTAGYVVAAVLGSIGLVLVVSSVARTPERRLPRQRRRR